jgi:hypothetical protein
VDRQLAIPLRPPRQVTRIGFPAGVFVPGWRGDLQNLAHRLDPELAHVGFHEGDHFLNGRSSSAAAK